ncbi:MAG: glycosyl transferase family 1, partial [Bacteroidota bacterium]
MILDFLRGNFFVPDPRVFWVKPSIRFLKKYLSKNPVSIVVTTGPPHSVHLIGLGLKKYFRDEIKWIADFRDPWSSWDILLELKVTNVIYALHRYLEKKVLSKCDLTLTVSGSWSEDFKKLGAEYVSCITNGFDSDDFESVDESDHKDIFQIVHMGLINSLRSSKELWQAIDNVISKMPNMQWKLTSSCDRYPRNSVTLPNAGKDIMNCCVFGSTIPP